MSPDEHPRLRGCAEGSTLLSDYHDGRFASGSIEAERIEAHLAVCPHCAEVLDDFRAISAAARVLKDMEVPALDLGRMRRTVRSGLRRAIFYRRLAWTGAGLGAAAAVAAAVIAFLVPTEVSPAPEVAQDRQKAIEALMAELSAQPEDITDLRERSVIRKQLEEVRLFGPRAVPRDWISIHEEVGLGEELIRLDELMRDRVRRRPKGGVIPVDSPSR